MPGDGTHPVHTSRAKTLTIDDRRIHEEVKPLVVQLLQAAAPDHKESNLRATTDLVLKAATRSTAINAAHRRIKKGPSRRTHARVLGGLDLAILENEVNHILWQYAQPHLPGGTVEVAIDLNDQPYHGQPHESPDELRRSKAKSGTTWFHGYATLYVIRNGKRYTIAIRFVRRHETPTMALKNLLHLSFDRGFTPSIVYADKGFSSREALEFLEANVPAAVVPLPYRGPVKRLCRGKGSHYTTYTIGNTNGDPGFTVRVAIVVKRNRDKYHGNKPGNQYFPYAVIGLDDKTPQRVARLYQNRGGIESSYKLVNRARPRTSSRNPAIRLFY